MKKMYKMLMLVALLGNAIAPLQAISLKGLKKKAKAGWQKTKAVAQKGIEKAKVALENPNIRKAAAITAGFAAAAAGAALLYSQTKEVRELANIDTSGGNEDALREIIEKIGKFANELYAAMDQRRLNAEFVGANPADLTATSFKQLARQIEELVTSYNNLLQSKVVDVINKNRSAYPSIVRSADAYTQIFSKLGNSLLIEKVLLDELAPSILGLEKGAPKSAVKKAYHRMARTWHPDKAIVRGLDRKDAEDKFKLIGDAYELLK